MASAKKKATKPSPKPSKFQSLTKLLLGGGNKKPLKSKGKPAPVKATAKGAEKAAAKHAKAVPAKAGASKAAKAVVAKPKAAASKAKVLPPPVAAKAAKVGKKGAVAPQVALPAKAAKGKAVVVAKPAVEAKLLPLTKAPKTPSTKPGRGGPRLPVRLFMETGTLLLGNPDGACREVACENQATTAGYCRGHYIKNWKRIKAKEQILREGRLNQYLEELLSKYTDKYIDAVKMDLASEKEFAKVITDLDLDESSDDFDSDSEPMENLIDTVKRDFEDETEAF